jgi:hypothetical protein
LHCIQNAAALSKVSLDLGDDWLGFSVLSFSLFQKGFWPPAIAPAYRAKWSFLIIWLTDSFTIFGGEIIHGRAFSKCRFPSANGAMHMLIAAC